jgi:hypothetical protein
VHVNSLSGGHDSEELRLRQALEYFWRELKGPHQAVARNYQAVARNYKVRFCLAWLVELQHADWCW